MSTDTTVKMIKKDAQINITFGTPFIQKLQALLFFITKDVSDEDLLRYKQIVENKEEFQEDWMDALFTVVSLIGEVERIADQTGQTTSVNPEDITEE